MIEICELNQRMDLLDEAVAFFWKQWGNDSNYKFYEDCIIHSCSCESDLPRFFIALRDSMIVASYALLRNDLISRQDLSPWFGCLYTVPEFRGNRIGSMMLEHAAGEAVRKGYKKLYLYTDLEGYYEKYGWVYSDDGYTYRGIKTKIYEKYLFQQAY